MLFQEETSSRQEKPNLSSDDGKTSSSILHSVSIAMKKPKISTLKTENESNDYKATETKKISYIIPPLSQFIQSTVLSNKPEVISPLTNKESTGCQERLTGDNETFRALEARPTDCVLTNQKSSSQILLENPLMNSICVKIENENSDVEDSFVLTWENIQP